MKDKGAILVVEDTPADLELLVDTLAAEGYQVLPAENGELALASVAARPPELILLDIQIPGLDGFEVCRRLKARPESRNIPVVFITVSGESAERVAGLKLGAVDYITKPFQRAELLARIQIHLELGRLRVRLERKADELRQTNAQLQSELAERKRAEEGLQFKNVLLTTQQEASIDGILVVDEAARILSYNRRFIEMWGLPAKLVEDKVDEPVLRFVIAQMQDPRSFLQRVQYLYEHKQETSRDELVLADGRVFDRYSAPMCGPEERYYGRVWYFRDITERKQAEEVLRQRVRLQDQLVHIAASVPGMIYSLLLRPDGSTRMPYASGILSDIFDLQPKDVIEDAAPVFSLIHPDDIGHVQATIAESARTLNPWRDDFRVCHTRLGEIWVEGHAVPQREPDGSVLWHGFVQNITERKRAQIELEKALASVKSLSGLLPICAGCKKIRDDKGYWSQVESYIQKHSEATFTHGLCPDCIKKYYPELEGTGPGNPTRQTPWAKAAPP